MDVKPGYKTSEFGVAVAALAASALNRKLGLDLTPEALLGLAGAASAYILSRGWLKVKAIAQ